MIYTGHCLRMTSESAAVLNILHMHTRRKVMRSNSIYCDILFTINLTNESARVKTQTAH